MGLTKRIMEYCTEDGMNLYGALGRFVCSDCICDPGLQRFVESHAVIGVCDFCEQEGQVAKLDEVIGFMNQCLAEDFDDAVDCLMHDSSEGGFLGKTYATWEVLDEFGFEVELEELRDAIIEGLGDRAWCDADPYRGSRIEQLCWSWDHFARVVKTKSRFFFREGPPNGDDDVLDPADLLSTVAAAAQEHGLFRTIQSGLVIYRVRRDAVERPLATPRDFGPPPPEHATQSNRMNPPGIPMLYGSLEPETALRETAIESGQYCIGKLVTNRPINVLDLTRIPSIQSIFEQSSNRFMLQFLHYFSREVSKRIKRDDRIHIEYIPTQVVTEYFRTMVQVNNQPLDGILFYSARHTECRTKDGKDYMTIRLECCQGLDASRRPELERWVASRMKNELNVSPPGGYSRLLFPAAIGEKIQAHL